MRKIAGLAAFLAAIASADGQTRQLELRVDSLAFVARQTRATLAAYDDSTARLTHALDTVYAGFTTIVADRSTVASARAIAPRIADSMETTIGAGAATSYLAGHVFRVRVQEGGTWRRARDTVRDVIVSVIGPNGAEMRGWRGRGDSADIAASLYHAMTYAMYTAADPAFFAWAGYSIPADTVTAAGWADQRLALVSATSALGRRCYEGEVSACKIALLLSPTADPVLEWHDSTSRRRLVRRNRAMARRIDAIVDRQCQGGSDVACIALLRQFPSGTFREPAPVALRAGFLKHAVAVGGSGAVDRLLAPGAGNYSVRLERASGLPIDSLVASWQTRVRHTHAPSEDLTIGIAIMALAWATGIGALSLRSSRWR